ncbi:hypothetical protein FACS189430_00480 [Bacteroidia bacterium]|nr:hypothetical protein FACS189430_00480 [Bacteroidia bacterium]
MAKIRLQSIKEKWLWIVAGVGCAVLVALLISYLGVLGGGVFILLPFAVFAIVLTYNMPILTLYGFIIYSFFVYAFDRYIVHDAFPVGILCDGLIFYIYALLFVKGVSRKISWRNWGDSPFIVLLIWLFYCIISLFNSESPGLDPWFRGIRPYLYLSLTVPLFCMLLEYKTIKIVLFLWGVCSMILTAKGFMQTIRLDSEETMLLATPFAQTHLLWGKLRVFSLLCDAGQFGVQQAHAATAGAILFLISKKRTEKIFFLLMGLTGLWGMFASGTRGAIFVILGGAMAYTFLVKNMKLLILAVVLGGGFYVFMRYTHIGDGNYSIYRMRTAFQPKNDASFNVRMINQKKLKAYLASRPFGGGLGSMEHGPENSLLTKIPYDSGYVLTWGDQGIVGVLLYIAMYLYFLVQGAYAVWFKIKNEWLRGVLIALIAGISGDMVAHYGNPIMLQHPTDLILIFSIGVIFCAPRIDRKLSEDKSETIITEAPTKNLQKR